MLAFGSGIGGICGGTYSHFKILGVKDVAEVRIDGLFLDENFAGVVFRHWNMWMEDMSKEGYC